MKLTPIQKAMAQGIAGLKYSINTHELMSFDQKMSNISQLKKSAQNIRNQILMSGESEDIADQFYKACGF